MRRARRRAGAGPPAGTRTATPTAPAFSSTPTGEPSGCLPACFNDAPCPPITSHGASITQPFGAAPWRGRGGRATAPGVSRRTPAIIAHRLHLSETAPRVSRLPATAPQYHGARDRHRSSGVAAGPARRHPHSVRPQFVHLFAPAYILLCIYCSMLFYIVLYILLLQVHIVT
jgi:hypothetical protein